MSERSSKRYLEIETASSVFTKLCGMNSNFERAVEHDDVTDQCSQGAYEGLPTIKTYNINVDGKVDPSNLAYQALCEAVDDKNPDDDSDYGQVSARYVTPTWTFAGTLIFDSLDENAELVNAVRFSLSGARFSGTVTKSATA